MGGTKLADIDNMTKVLFLPGDLTQLKSTIRRILLELNLVGYRREQPIVRYDTVDTITKIVTTAIALERIGSAGAIKTKADRFDRRIVWQSGQDQTPLDKYHSRRNQYLQYSSEINPFL